MKPTTLSWSETEPSETFSDPAALRSRLEEIAAQSARKPVLASLESPPFLVFVGLGYDESTLLVQRERDDDGLAVEWSAIGDESRDGDVDFWIHGQHHTPVEARYFLPNAKVLDLAIAFLSSHELSPLVEWEQNDF